MDVGLLVVYIVTVFMLIATPGPVVLLVVNTAIRSGPSRAFSTILGTNWASLILIIIAIFILSSGLVIAPKVFHIISLLGCIFIGYLAIDSIRGVFKTPFIGNVEREASVKLNNTGGLVNGFLIGLSNPKDIIFFVSFFPQFIKVTDSFNSSIFLLTALWIILDFSILIFYIFFMRKLASQRIKHIIVLISSLLLLSVAITGFFYSVFELKG